MPRTLWRTRRGPIQPDELPRVIVRGGEIQPAQLVAVLVAVSGRAGPGATVHDRPIEHESQAEPPEAGRDSSHRRPWQCGGHSTTRSRVVVEGGGSSGA